MILIEHPSIEARIRAPIDGCSPEQR